MSNGTVKAFRITIFYSNYGLCTVPFKLYSFRAYLYLHIRLRGKIR